MIVRLLVQALARPLDKDFRFDCAANEELLLGNATACG